MAKLVTRTLLVLAILVLGVVSTASASITEFYVLPDINAHVYLLSRATVWSRLDTDSNCLRHHSSLASFETNQEFLEVTSYLNTFLKTTGLTFDIFKGIWINGVICHYSIFNGTDYSWKNEKVKNSVWATGQPSSLCNTCSPTCCERIGVNSSLLTNGLWYNLDCADNLLYLCKVKDECAFSETNKCTHLCTDEDNGYTCSCKPGYVLTHDNYTCVDIDECHGTTPSPCQQLCNNTNGTYTCGCYDGYKLNIDKLNCDDIDECTTRTHNCDDICNNTNGSYNCSCRPGFELRDDSRSCYDIDECKTGVHKCGDICNNTNGSYNCSCRPGFELGDDSKSCIDVNECNTSYHECEHVCINLNGSFNCSCHPGFKLGNDSKNCLYIDECNMTHQCQHNCNNVNGSYICSCNEGFQLGNDSINCFDINECNNSNPINHNCTNVNASYNSYDSNVNGSYDSYGNIVNASYNSFGSNVNASYNSYGYNVNASYNSYGNNANASYNSYDNIFNASYNSSCRQGFQLTNGGRDCVDIDECFTTSHNCSHNCNNTHGSYKCTCEMGYELSSDLVTCQRFNESGNATVNSEQNRNISVTGNCSRGFVLDPNDNVTCRDIDECSDNPCNHTCRNTPGSYTCSCQLGFTLDSDLVTCRYKGSHQYLCPCKCSSRTLRTSYAPAVILKEKEEIRRRLKLYKEYLLSHRRSKGCADDSRISAKAVGYGGILIAVVFVSVFITSDLIRAARLVWEFLRNKIGNVDRERV